MSKSTAGQSNGSKLNGGTAGRVVLIGDAAHASSPMMGQGGSMAMEDALVLAESLCSTRQAKTAIEMFVARRKQRVDWVQQQSRAVGDMLGMPPGRRNSVLRERGQSAFMVASNR